MLEICAVAVTIASALSPAMGHMPYVLPSAFEAARDRITIEASFGEDAFRPEIAMKDAPFEVTRPDGKTVPLAAPTLASDLTVVEASLPVEGLYRVSSGQRLGRVGKMYRTGNVWTIVGEGAAPPAGATFVDVRSATIADAYVLRGKPGASGALTVRGKALEIHPLGDPASYSPGAPAAFEILYDGKPLAGEAVTLFREAGVYDGRKQAGTATTDEAGRITLTPPDAGRYLLLARHRTATPAGRDAYTSFTATLAFEAL
ncbi:hypothetical protein ASG11_06020 [Sphingomonas sp. Leaf357]|nr:hypothetical protein ASG11_06020 [Sphingomonas sp. Leaf357]